MVVSALTRRTQYKIPRVQYKTMCVLWHKQPHTLPRYLLVRDRMHQEWTFISGCCRHNEKPVNCAMRELREETKDAVNIVFTRFNCRTFQMSARKNCVNMLYSVYIVDITNYKSPAEIVNQFKASTRQGKAYNENDDLCFTTLEAAKAKVMWSVSTQVIKHRDFAAIHRDICRGVPDTLPRPIACAG